MERSTKLSTKFLLMGVNPTQVTIRSDNGHWRDLGYSHPPLSWIHPMAVT